MSSLTWLDFSDAERKRALQVVELFGRPETRDELGLGAIRDAFANAMFPGISTVQRRARYFLFVPWTFREAERRYAGRTDALERVRREELALIEALLSEGETDGVIGGRARKNLRQVPSMIYWNGLESWGIRRTSGSREQWGRALMRSGGTAVDDDGQLVAAGASWWHSGVPEPPEGWPEQAALTLRPEDAQYLRERIRDRCAGTVLATLVERHDSWDEVAFLWNLPMPELSDMQRTLVRHAQRFSETMHSAALLYNHALAQAEENSDLERDYRERLEAWIEQERQADRAAAPLSDTWALLAEVHSRHSPRTREFVEEWFAATSDPSAVLDDPGLVAQIRNRERQVKKRQARLSFDAARETWRGAAGAGQLDYRWASAQRQLLDIVSVDAA
jgi:Family of unknown function (DUF6361)